MATVEVDVDDLETLIFAAAAIKQIEQALLTRKNDPFVKPHLANTDALKSITAAWQSHKRSKASTLVEWDGELDDRESQFLGEVVLLDSSCAVTGDYRLKHPEIDRLAAKGCIQLGQCVEGALWSGEDRPELKPKPFFAVRITKRGLEKYTHDKS